MDAIDRARLSLEGLSVGDALGERFFGHEDVALDRIRRRQLPPAPWRYTDDTEMALSIVETLEEAGEIDQDLLASKFAKRYDHSRGYGSGAHLLLQAFWRGVDWRIAARSLFGGRGSLGNGAAMRVAPLGAWFAGDPHRAAEQASLSAAVTHAHPEGRAGAVAVAVAAAVASEEAERLLDEVLAHTPAGATRDRIARAAQFPLDEDPCAVAILLGAGESLTAQDTVPYTIWCAAHNIGSYEQAFWATVSALGDRDTTCAIVGGIVAAGGGRPPEDWVASREPLPDGFET